MADAWIELPDVPSHMEGNACWMWSESSNNLPHTDVVPTNYSRLRHHCEGIWIKPLVRPLPPEIVKIDKEE